MRVQAIDCVDDKKQTAGHPMNRDVVSRETCWEDWKIQGM